MEADRDCALGDQTSRRLAVCNVDWDRISAKDLYGTSPYTYIAHAI